MAMSKKAALRKWNADNPTDTIEFKEGKGRLSGKANAKLNELVTAGWDIEGMTISRSTANSAPVVKKEKATPTDVIEIMPYRYDEKAFKAVSTIEVFGKTEFGMREVCNNTGFSLVGCHWCPDDQHRILGVPIRVVPV